MATAGDYDQYYGWFWVPVMNGDRPGSHGEELTVIMDDPLEPGIKCLASFGRHMISQRSLDIRKRQDMTELTLIITI